MDATTHDLLRFATAGSVDDGKSTLVGRLLHDTKSILADAYEAVERVTRERGGEGIDLALLTDGLRAEREQGITIDVAYRYFATPRRTFILADCPGHVQYTRNTVTGASTADAIVVLVDVRTGVADQTRRHLAVAALLRVPHVIVAVNKMDLLGWERAPYDAIVSEFAGFADRLNIPDLTFVPISALHGENVVTRSSLMPWYDGPSLLHHLEHVHVSSDRNLVDVRFPVQYVIRPQSARFPDYRGYAGRVASGVLKPGDEVVVLPSGFGTRIASIETADGPVDEAYPPMSVTVRLEDELDVSRGDMICRPHNQPTVTQDVDAMVCWMDEASALRPGARLVLKHTTRSCRALVKDLQYRLDVNTLHRDLEASELVLNEVGRVRLRTTQPVFVDSYARNRATGGFVLIDEQTNKTVGAGMISQLD